jgi:multidrug efflux pump subunit AcrA (membrane-fusion protein)
MRRRTVVINAALALALVGTAAGGWLAIGTPSAATAATSQTTRVTLGSVTSTVTASGNSASAKTRDVAFAGSGTITEIFVKAGAHVASGAKLARLDDTDAKASLRTARASLASAAAQLSTATAGQTSAERARGAAQLSAAQVSVDNANTQLTAANQSYALDKAHQDAMVVAAGNTSGLAQVKRTRASTLLRDSQAITSAKGQLATARTQLASQQASNAVDAQPAKPGTVAAAQAQVESARVQVDSAQTALDKTLLLAPMSGTVAAVNGTVGGSSGGSSSSSGTSNTTSSSSTSSTSSSSFITLTDVSQLQVTAAVAEADAVKVELGQAATVTFSAAGLSVTGTVTAIDVEQTVTNNVVTYGVTITLIKPPSSLRIGQTASVVIVADTKNNVLRTASNAVTTRGTQSTVTVRRDGKDQVVTVKTGLVGDGGTEIISGLAEGDTLVVPTTSGSAGGFTFPGGGLGGGLRGGVGGR